jgi:WD40 repeat protein
LKGARNLKFSNGGHFFAANDGGDVVVYKFFTAEPLYRFTRHKTLVRSLAWIDDDSAVASTAADNTICVWKLSQHP